MKEKISVTATNNAIFSYYFDSLIGLIPLVILIIVLVAVVKLYMKLSKFLDKNS